MLVADDYAISGGVSAGIESLARGRRISGASAIVTLARWPRDAARLGALRGDIAIGLHLNLTLGAPLGAMAKLAPAGALPRIRRLTAAALGGQIERGEIAAETARQLALFERETGCAPDFIDGHQHVHVLPVIRRGVLDALGERFAPGAPRPLVRIPADRPAALIGRRRAAAKAAVLSVLSAGARRLFERAGFPVNDGFAGVTSFAADDLSVERDLAAAASRRRGLTIAMCHPGLATAELRAIDAITDRREVELALLGADNALTPHLWHPARAADGAPIDWAREREVAR